MRGNREERNEGFNIVGGRIDFYFILCRSDGLETYFYFLQFKNVPAKLCYLVAWRKEDG